MDKNILRFLICILVLPGLTAQEPEDTLQWDSNYLEDQFYVGLTYNFVLNKPQGVTQRSLSYGLMAGFIKDIPLNARRNIAMGIGLGYGVNSYYTNLRATAGADGIEYTILDANSSFRRNKLETHLIEMPIEFRWRNSTATDYKFWRIYGGLKLAYAVGSRSKLVAEGFKDSFYNTDIRNFRYGIMMNFGYNTFNIHAYYALNSLLDKDTTTTGGEDITLTPLRIGLIFYIL